MVFYFTSNVVDPPAFIYVGKDKVENEDLIAHGWPEDIWFHVDNLSSAHIYLRLPPTTTWDAIPTALLTDCAQLTKANSIEGNKKDNVTIIYTPWSNLKKSGNMATGQVGFKNDKMVKRVYVEKRENVIVNRLNKTKVEKFPDLREEKAEREKELRKVERIAAQEKKKEEAKVAEERQRLKWQKDHMYDDLHADDNMAESSNQDRDEDFLDDFM
ncbi:Coiled-coil domain-containing protein 25 [Fulvia fulva]|uniref:Coiled-coil domain-containing protein 25 n=1 Tax=Passalora fulva TaxID=5499 RepID=A0A9Q8L912_PASFU|nr:Coiled-coil domain-containing protein 25 [Fulvia fulva]KAK4634236.1 Coiled-coil domain-containing protein 25 [Fulvia fulva]KAK4638109.1 Coiled-coil domain-containing protein 25 [Fulvia fulva]UJO12428.1 Coiled-coil domain-containing protein 25 [Fulvia fulva]WPV10199.1 Coiled-coil domain-containing protein 25 [Fulvia fulva]WPV24733.1 Coiled-coil domain-containing protein 25 [Fulvia fulva]